MENEVVHWKTDADRYSVAVIVDESLSSMPVIEIESEAFPDHWQTRTFEKSRFMALRSILRQTLRQRRGRRHYTRKQKSYPPSPVQLLLSYTENNDFSCTLNGTKSAAGKAIRSLAIFDADRLEMPMIRLVNLEIEAFADSLEYAISHCQSLGASVERDKEIPSWLR